jgi:cell wall-associated NlpC family hydrolase
MKVAGSSERTDVKKCARSQLISTVLALVVSATGCGRRTPPRLPGTVAPASPGKSDVAPDRRLAAVVESALALQGTPYRNGGTAPTGFDCSGLVQYVFAQQGIALPRSAREQFDATVAVPRDAVAPGDLVFFETVGRGPSHVGIVVGDDWFVHAPSGSGVVRLERLSAQYWSKRYLGTRRVTR